jgi:hypothetical protein
MEDKSEEIKIGYKFKISNSKISKLKGTFLVVVKRENHNQFI